MLPTFVKLDQVLSTRPDLLSSDYIAEPTKFQGVTKILTQRHNEQVRFSFREIN